MNAWNPDLRSYYDQQNLGFLTNFDGKTRLHATKVAFTFRKVVSEEGADPNDPKTLQQAQKLSDDLPGPRIPFETLNWLSFTMMLSELGKHKELNDLLEYADTFLNPTWENGGLYYPRNDTLMDENYNLIHVEPHSGNSGIGYARLNVENGQRKMWQQPWTRELLGGRPWVDDVSLGDDVDFLRGIWDDAEKAMILTLRRWRGKDEPLTLTIKDLPAGRWAVYTQDELKKEVTLNAVGDIHIEEVVGLKEVDIVVVQV